MLTLPIGLPVRSAVADGRRGQIPNPKRPSNPFTNTDEPDWIKVGHSSGGRARDQSQSTKGSDIPPRIPQREAINRTTPTLHHSHSMQTSPSNGRVSRIAESEQFNFNQSLSGPGPSNPTSALLRKPAPPVPKKPAQLSSPESTTSEFARVSPVERSNNASAGASTLPPPPPRRNTKSISSSTSAEADLRPQFHSPDVPSRHSSVPPLPQRSSTIRFTNNNLLDEDVDAARDIPSLKPTRPK